MNSEKEDAVRNAVTRMGQMFTNPTYGLFKELFTEDCDYITFDGQRLKGIQANYEAHLRLSSLWVFKGVRLAGEQISVKFVNENTAIVISKGALVFRWQKKASTSRMSINTSVLVFNGGRWKVCAFQNTRIKVPSLFIRVFGKARNDRNK